MFLVSVDRGASRCLAHCILFSLFHIHSVRKTYWYSRHQIKTPHLPPVSLLPLLLHRATSLVLPFSSFTFILIVNSPHLKTHITMLITPVKTLALLGLASAAANAAVVTYNWNITYVNTNPDGLMDRRVIGINGQFPYVSPLFYNYNAVACSPVSAPPIGYFLL